MKKKILHVYPQLNCGGTEMVIYNLVKFIDRDKFNLEILTRLEGDNEIVFKELGVKIHSIAKISERDYYSKLVKFFKSEVFDVIHAHMDVNLPIVLKAAYEAGIPVRIAHSHNARVDIPQFLWSLMAFRHHRYEKYATVLFGCSSLALKWLFPFKWKSGYIIHNGIDLNKFKFDPQIRLQVRNQFGIGPSTKVFINVGRCTEQKNQQFILELAKERAGYDELYVIIGDGPLLVELNQYKEDNGLNNVLLLGRRFDVPEWLCAADVFLFPSIYEGLGIVAIEAEACGLSVLTSDMIPIEADLGIGNLTRLSLKDKGRWHDYMSQIPFNNQKRSEISDAAQSSDYNIRRVTDQVESIYLMNY